MLEKMLAKFMSPITGARSNKKDQEQQRQEDEKPKKAPPQRLDISKESTPDRWRPAIGASDAEFQEIWEMFSKMRQGDDRLSIDDILEKHFTKHEASLFLPVDRQKRPGLAYIQRVASRRYHKLIKTQRFSTLKQASYAEVLISKLTMHYFGLPVAPYSFISFDDQPLEEEYEDGINYDNFEIVHPNNRPLRFLNKYSERSYGKDISRKPDGLFENFYGGLSELQWAGHIAYEPPSFSELLAMSSQGPSFSSKTGLRGGAGSHSELDEPDYYETSFCAKNHWRLCGWQGQIVISGRIAEFQSAVDRLLGFTDRGGYQAVLNRYNKEQGKLDRRSVFITGTRDEAQVFNAILEEPDPHETKFTFFITTTTRLAPAIGDWYPDKTNKNIIKIKAKGQPDGNCAYLQLPFFARSHIGANEYNLVFATAARIIFHPLCVNGKTPSVLPSVVRLAFGDDDERFTYSLGGLNIPRSFVEALQDRARRGITEDIYMIRGSSYWEDETGLFIPSTTYDGVAIEDKEARKVSPSSAWNISSYSCPDQYKDGSPADFLWKYIVTRFTPAEINEIDQIQVWAPGDAIWDPKANPGNINVSLERGIDDVAAKALGQMLQNALRTYPQDMLFFSARPTYKQPTKAFIATEDGNMPGSVIYTDQDDSQCFLFTGDVTLAKFRQQVKNAFFHRQDIDWTKSAVLIQQSDSLTVTYEEMAGDEKRWVDFGAKLGEMESKAFEKILADFMRAGRNDYIVQPSTSEEEWKVIKRFVISQQVLVRIVPAWSAPESLVTETLGCSPGGVVQIPEKVALAIPRKNQKGKQKQGVLPGESSKITGSMSRPGPEFEPNPLGTTQIPNARGSNGRKSQFSKRAYGAGGSSLAHYQTAASTSTGATSLASFPPGGSLQKTAPLFAQPPATAEGPRPDGNLVPSGPPALQGKWPLTDAQRIKFLREQTYANPISIYDGGKPHAPINAPPLETFLHGGNGLPSVSLAMMSLTEQWSLQEQYVHMRNLALERTIPCPYPACAHTFSVDKLDAMRAHIEQSHAWEGCNFCKERLYRHWTQEKRLQHFLTKHMNVISSSKAAGPLVLPQADKAAQSNKTKKAVSFETFENPSIVVTEHLGAQSTSKIASQTVRRAHGKSPTTSNNELLRPDTSKKPSTRKPYPSSSRSGRADQDHDIEYDETEQEDDDFEDDDYEEYAETRQTPKKGGRLARRLAAAERERERASAASAKKPSPKRKAGEKDSRYIDDGDKDDPDHEPAEAPAAKKAATPQSKKQKVSHRAPKAQDGEWNDSGNSDDYSIPSAEDEPGPDGAAKRRALFSTRAENDPSWKPRKGSGGSAEEDDAELEASAVPEGEDSVLADIQEEAGGETGSASKKRNPLDPSYRLPKNTPADEDDPALIKSLVPEPGLPGILNDTPTKKRKRSAADAEIDTSTPAGTNFEQAQPEDNSQDVEPANKKVRATPAAKKATAGTRKISGPKTPSTAKTAPAPKSTAKKVAAAKPTPAPKAAAKRKPTPAKHNTGSDEAPVRRSTRAVSKEIQ